MDKARAKLLAEKVEGKICSGWLIEKYINCGKSAIVLRASKGAQLGAIKLFDPELIASHGFEIQKQRIERERSLVGKSHPHLIEILDGGFWDAEKLFYVVMEFLPWDNLADSLKSFPVGKEREIISQIASSAQYLEGLEICHRDIKPENIAINSDFTKAKLLDLGVIKPVGAKPITDGTQGKVFIGTLKYSAPEFLLRKEVDTPEGWRAITYYQLGGVLHDLIMRRSLFSEYENPFAELVNAVQHVIPSIESESVSPALVDLARNCLLKKPQLRLQLVSWDSFKQEPTNSDPVADARARISRRQIAKSDWGKIADPTEQALKLAPEKLNEYANGLLSACRLECIEQCRLFPPIEIHPLDDGGKSRCIVIQFEPSANHDFIHHLRVEVCVCWLDAGSDVVEISCGAGISNALLPAKKKILKNWASVFKGAFTHDSARKNVLAALYGAFEKALHVKRLPKGDTAVHELGLEAEKK